MDFLILGPLEARVEGRELPLGGTKQRALLALLLLHRNEVVSTDRLIDGLWGEEPPATAVKVVQVYVSRLRRLLGPSGPAGGRLVTRPPGYLLRLDPDELDLDRFEALVEEARRAGAAGDPAAAAAALRRGLAMWRGPPLADLAFEPFAQAAAARLEEQRLAALESRIEADLALGRAPELIGELGALVARASAAGAPAQLPGARPLPRRPPGRGARGLPGGPARPRRRPGDRAQPRPGRARAGDPAPRPGAGASGAARAGGSAPHRRRPPAVGAAGLARSRRRPGGPRRASASR